MSNEQWGNIPLPGLSDDKLLNTNWTKSATSKAIWTDPAYRVRLYAWHAARGTDPVWMAAMDRRNNNPAWQKNVRSGATKRDATWKENSIKGVKLANSKPIVTPFGVFASITEACNYQLELGLSNACKKIYNWLKTDPTNYYRITVEEYIMLTGKDIV